MHRAREEGKDVYARKKLKSNTMEASSCRIHVVIDCSFNDQMSEKVHRAFIELCLNELFQLKRVMLVSMSLFLLSARI
jgi:hypothetical protein